MHYLQCLLLAFIYMCVMVQSVRASSSNPIVKTNIGMIQGLKSDDDTYAMYLGIPYATVNESNPFGAATPHPGFDETFEAYEETLVCPQTQYFNLGYTGSLDCLRINVYVSESANSTNPLPILVFVHGGGYVMGFASRTSFDPKFLMRQDIILVTLNYRLGPYGFMCLDTPDVPGNQGLKDQRLALRWVKNNMEAFGGDVNKITLMGHSAGAGCSDLHLMDNDNIFHNIILNSGNALGPWAVTKSDPSGPLRIAEYLGFSTNYVSEALLFISNADPKLIIDTTTALNFYYRPCVEKKFDGVESFMTEHPLHANVTRVKNIPILMGVTDDETITEILFLNDDIIKENFLQFFSFESNDDVADMTNLMRRFYLCDEDVNEETVFHLKDYHADFTFYHPTQRRIENYIGTGAKTLYQYMFSYIGGRNYHKNDLNITVGGVAHGDDLGYLFDTIYIQEEPSPEDQLIIDRMTTLWANFMKYGNPIPETSELLPIEWLPVSEDTFIYLNIDTELSLKQRIFHDRIAFLDMFYELNERFQNGFEDTS